MIQNTEDVLRVARATFGKTGLAEDAEYKDSVRELEEREEELYGRLLLVERRVRELTIMATKGRSSKRELSRTRSRSLQLQKQLHRIQGQVFRLHVESMQVAVRGKP